MPHAAVAPPQTRKSSTRNPFLCRLLLWLGASILACAPLLQAAAQGGTIPSNAQNAFDYRSRSDVKVDPATGALQLQITLGSYKGRSGLDLPVKVSYSSKVWEMRHHGTIFRGSECQDCQGEPDATYHPHHALYSAGGWTSSLDWFHWGEPPTFETYDEMGRPCISGCTTQIARLYIKMPDGSRHEFMKDNFFHPLGTLPSGIYHSVDGSRLRYDASTGKLYLPDGSRHERVEDPDGVWRRYFIDRHGNRLVYDETARLWKDTLGRDFALPPLDSSAPAERTYSLPGLSVPFKFVWKRLEHVRTDQNQELHYTGDRTGTWPHTPVTPHLFTSPSINDNVTDGNGQRFNPVLLHQIVLPNGTAYTFTYNVYGEIDKVVYPTGGYERFVHGMVSPLSSKATDLSPGAQTNRGVHQRVVSAKGDGSDEAPWVYNSGPTAFVVSPDNTRTETKFHLSDGETVLYGYENPLAGRPYEEKVVSATGLLLRRKLTEWVTDGATHQSGPYVMHVRRNPRVAKEVEVVLDPTGAALSATTLYEYDADLNVKKVKRYDYRAVSQATAATAPIGDFLAGSLLRVEETDYLTGVQEYRDRQMISLPTATRVRDAAGTIIAQTAISYDEASIGLHPCAATKGWVDPATSFHGNATTVKTWLNTSGAWFETHAEYDKCGNLRISRDAHEENAAQHGRASEVVYDDAFSDGVDRGTYAYPTKTVSAVPDASGQRGSSAAFEAKTVYNFSTGSIASMTDVNGQTTLLEYTDQLLRPTRVIPPPGGNQIIYEYGDFPGNLHATVKKQIGENTWDEGVTYFDGLGRTVKTLSHDARGEVFSETVYDTLGRVSKTSNPYRPGEEKHWIETVYDALGRIKEVISPKIAGEATAAKIESDYSVAAVGGQLGLVHTGINQAGRRSRSITNVSGQLIRVDEPDETGALGPIDNPTRPTYYSYDVAGNLRKVAQGQQSRYFFYDSLGRLLRVSQPEQDANPALAMNDPVTGNGQWSTGSTYDARGNVLTTTDAKGVTTVYEHDGLNRVVQRSYTIPQTSDPKKVTSATPTVTFKYDGRLSPSPGDPNPAVVPHAAGMLTEVSNGISTTQNTDFDNLGRVEASRQIVDGREYPFGYEYNFSGALRKQTYPSGRVVTNTFDNAGDLSSVSSSGKPHQTPKVYASGFVYTADGSVERLKLGNDRWETYQFNARNQITQLGLGVTPTDTGVWKLNYEYGRLRPDGTVDVAKNDGNVLRQTITVPGVASPFVQAYAYDSLNRLAEAVETFGGQQTWKQNYAYDRYGNRTGFSQVVAQTPLALNNVNNPAVDPLTNRFVAGQGYEYDHNGNLIRDAEGRGFVFDGDNKQSELKDTNGHTAATYAYDGSGRRVKKTVAGTQEVTVFVYDAGGKLAAEYSSVAPPNPTTRFITADLLGTPRVITDGVGEVISRKDYMPFGEDLYASRSTDQKYGLSSGVRQGFTGYEKDEESQLNFAEARYYNPSHARFTTVDPLLASGKSSNPQTLNRYAYAGNNPTLRVDPNGEAWYYTDITKLYSNGATRTFREFHWNSGRHRVGRNEHIIYANAGDRIGWHVMDPFEHRATQVSSPEEAAAQLETYKRQAALNFLMGAAEAASLLVDVSGLAEGLNVETNSDQYKAGMNAGTILAGASVITGAGAANFLVKHGFSRATSKAVVRELKVFNKVCFVAGTPVHTDEGLKAIEEVKVGDKVLSWDEAGKRFEYKRVVRTFASQAERLVKVYVAGERRPIEATPEHPFYARAHRARDGLSAGGDEGGQGIWVEAGSLRAGDLLLRANGEWAEVLGVEGEERGAAVYNFEVEDNHNYFVGARGALVHNTCVADIGKKLDFLFGKATGRLHNLERSAEMQRQLNSIGIFDNQQGREYLTGLLNEALNNPNSVTGISSGGNTIREFLIAGPNGILKAESYWNGNVLQTVVLYGR